MLVAIAACLVDAPCQRQCILGSSAFVRSERTNARRTVVFIAVCAIPRKPCLVPQTLSLVTLGLGGGLYYAHQQGMLDGVLGAPPAQVRCSQVPRRDDPHAVHACLEH